MIFGIGVDLVEVARMKRDLEKYGERFPKRLLTDVEFAEFEKDNNKSEFIARSFAAKEAAFKAFGTGMRNQMTWLDIAIQHDSLGKPIIVYREKAKDFIQRNKVTHSHISLTDEHHYAIAYVVLERET